MAAMSRERFISIIKIGGKDSLALVGVAYPLFKEYAMRGCQLKIL
jgi:hypothetical protein